MCAMEEQKSDQGKTFQKRKHLTNKERFPRVFKIVVRILTEVKSYRKSLKNAVYDSKLPKHLVSKVLSLSTSILDNLQTIDKIIKKAKLLENEKFLKLEMAEVLIHEVIIKGHPISNQSKPVQIVMQYEAALRKAYKKVQNKEKSNGNSNNASGMNQIQIPRYVRINTLVTTVPEVISWFRCNGFREILWDKEASTLDEYHDHLHHLKSGEFVKDFHFQDVLAFSKGINFSTLSPYQNGHIFLQDKSSYIPVHVLRPEQESIVLDCCAAPGMKTAHLAAVMNNKGKIIALDMNCKRFETLQGTLQYGGIENCTAKCLDFLETDLNSEEYTGVRYILLDPTCSGSGMVNRMDYVTNDEFSESSDRIKKLAGFQILLLKHALSFKKVKRVVYSTCSMNEEENEYVVQEALQHHSEDFKVVSIFPEWPLRGSDQYSFGELCVRASPQESLTNGFFVAVLQRIKKKHKKKKCHEMEMPIS